MNTLENNRELRKYWKKERRFKKIRKKAVREKELEHGKAIWKKYKESEKKEERATEKV